MRNPKEPKLNKAFVQPISDKPTKLTGIDPLKNTVELL